MKKKKLRFMLYGVSDNQSWPLVSLYRELVARRHHVDVYVEPSAPLSYIPFLNEDIDWKDINKENFNALGKKYDVLFSGSYGPFRRNEILEKNGLCIGNWPGYPTTWMGISKLESFCQYNLFITVNRYHIRQLQKAGFKDEFPAVGMLKNDLYPNRKREKKAGEKIVGFYPEASPYIPASKDRFMTFLEKLTVGNNNLKCVIKKRFVRKNANPHLKYPPIKETRNVEIKNALSSFKDLLIDSDFLIGVEGSSAFWEAAYMRKKIFCISDFDDEYLFDRKFSQYNQQIFPFITNVESNEFIKNFPTYYNSEKPVDETLYREIFPHDNVAETVINMIEIIHDITGKSDLNLEDLNFFIPYTDPDTFRKEAEKLYLQYHKEPGKFYEKRKLDIIKYKGMEVVIDYVKHMFPYLDYEIYKTFIAGFEKEVDDIFAYPAPAQDKLNFLSTRYKDIGKQFIHYLKANNYLDETIIPKKGNILFDEGKRRIGEAVYILMMLKETKLLEKLYEENIEQMPELDYYLGRMKKKSEPLIAERMLKKIINSRHLKEELKESAWYHLAETYENSGNPGSKEIFRDLFLKNKGKHQKAGEKLFVLTGTPAKP
ncbi:MAG: hypothetical protein GY757_59030 [bacterium]|nr:hypothetical protein [bacterium]